MNDSRRLPIVLKKFVDSEEWTFAKTMPEWPHEYLVRDRVDTSLFESLVNIIAQLSCRASLALFPIAAPKKPALGKPAKQSCRQFPKAGCSRNSEEGLDDHVKRILPHRVIGVTDNEVDPSVNGKDIVAALTTVEKVGPTTTD